MVTKNQIKLIRSLELKKNRRKEGLFVAEGPKVVGDLMRAGFHPTMMFSEDGSMGEQVSADELRRMSFLQHPQGIVGVFETVDEPMRQPEGLCLALDGVQDPGNLGTIIRIADWFGISTLYCSPDTADEYNPKVVQATMGSIAHVHIVHADLPSLLSALPSSFPVYGTLLDGDNIYEQPLSAEGIIVMGNEGNGISAEVRRHVSHRLLIPHFHEDDTRAESLNVAIATAITCAEFRRRGLSGI